ncbi:hypothetical protein EUX98_g7049 [Antrodiella citrinella]|uniref:Beta-lactamase-related domain-containing protein n=1 Tax=Antrodiella citrinella TaxID=2447956 RepID=A0A4S4MMI8_9APHY|nr:hypothetical protein EUX98_g7049 [Antrodiella citrinella]
MLLLSVLVALVSLALGGHYSGFWYLPTRRDAQRWECHPFLPKSLLVDYPPPVTHPLIVNAGLNLDHHLSRTFANKPIDSLSVAVVSAHGPLYQANFGKVRGNDSGSSEETTSETIYRVASVTKLLPVYEALMLERKGALSWDDPVQKYIPDFTYRTDGFAPDAVNEPSAAPITLRHCATHLSGLGRDWPPGTVANFPKSLYGAGPPPTNGLPFPSHDDVLRATEKYKLTSPPGKYPAYSNTGTSLLSRSLVIANKRLNKESADSPNTITELFAKDIFEPLGMNGSGFSVTPQNAKMIAVPSLAPEVTDQDLLDAMNPAAGQYSSLSDLIKFTQTLLKPSSFLTEQQLDQWFTPVFAFEEDDWTEMGMMWEIVKIKDSYGRPRRIFWKLGAMAGHHAALAIHPGTSIGMIVLLAGHFPDAAQIAYFIFSVLQPAIDNLFTVTATQLYSGTFTDPASNSTAMVSVKRGTLWLDRYVLDGTDVLGLFGVKQGGRMALRSSGRKDEFRLDTGIPGYNGMVHMGCYPYWNGQDLWGVKNGAAVNVVVFTEGQEGKRLWVPSTNITLSR